MAIGTVIYDGMICTVDIMNRLPEKLKLFKVGEYVFFPVLPWHCFGPFIHPINILSPIESKAQFPEFLPP